MIPAPSDRDVLFKTFARALFNSDMDALFSVVSADFKWSYHDGVSGVKTLSSPQEILAHLNEQKALFAAQRFHEIVYHHTPASSFMTMRVSETVRATGEQREQSGIEHYLFKDGKIATKDVYRKPIGE